MIQQSFADIVTPDLSLGAILNNTFSGFRDDYLVVHALIKKHKPKTFFEIGTSAGIGTRIIKNAVGNDGTVLSLELPDERLEPQFRGLVGRKCSLPFIQLRGDSLTFDFAQYPCEGYFIDGDHSHQHVFSDTRNAAQQTPLLIIWHDANTLVVFNAIVEAMQGTNYQLYQVADTRIAYALKLKK